MLSIVSIIFRALQFLCGLVVLGLSAALFKAQVYGSAPTTITYSIVTGSFAAFAALVGIVTLFFESLPGIISVGIDGVAGLLLLAGGIAWAVGLKGINCNDLPDSNGSDTLLSEGTTDYNGQTAYGYWQHCDTQDTSAKSCLDYLTGRCKKGQADEVIQFIAFGICMVLLGVGFILMRQGGRGSRATTRYV